MLHSSGFIHARNLTLCFGTALILLSFIMAAYFPRSRHLLRVDRSPLPILWIVVPVAIATAWYFWSVSSEVGIYIKSKEAQVVVDTFVIDLQSPVTDRISAVRISLGTHVRKGDTLVILEVSARRKEYEEEQTRLKQIGEQIAATDLQISALERMAGQQKEAGTLSIEQMAANVAEAEAAAQFAESRATRMKESSQGGSVSTEELERAGAEASAERKREEGLHKSLSRTAQENQATASRIQGEIEGLRGDRAELEAEGAAARGKLALLEEEIDRRAICAPVDGRIAEIYNIAPGSVLSAGESFGAILPEGKLKVVARFDPASGPGRIAVGQNAQIEFAGFPRIQYGTTPAQVSAVAGEPHENRWKVELTLLPDSTTPIPIGHGLQGSVEIQIERVSPITLLLRLIGAAAE